MTNAQMKKQEEQWRAESDAHMLAQYQELLNDKPRLRRAVRQAKKEAENLNKQASRMSKAANMEEK